MGKVAPSPGRSQVRERKERLAVNKISWTLARNESEGADEFRARLLAQLAPEVGQRLRGLKSLALTVQNADEFSGALVPVGAASRPADVLVEAVVDDLYVPLDPLHELLEQQVGHFQGWRIRSTVIFDASQPAELGQPSDASAVIAFVERLDGVTPAHFDHNWFVHAGHSDGLEAESPESIAERKREEQVAGGRYLQNRVVEAVTPTAWLIHGYTQLFFPMFMPPLDEVAPYERVRGEEPFDRWPPRILQGREYRVR